MQDPWTYVVLTDCGYHCLDPLVYTSHEHMQSKLIVAIIAWNLWFAPPMDMCGLN
jgi:hypothetical protein